MYRSPAIDHLSSPEDLNALQIIVSRRAWLANVACGVICLAALAWAVFGRIPVTVQGTGVLINPGNVRHVQSPAAGQIKELLIEVGQPINKGDLLARLKQPELEKQIEQEEATLLDEQALHSETSQLEAERWRMEKESADEQLAFLKSEVSKAKELADAVRERDQEYTKAQRINLTDAETISQELQKSFQQQFQAFESLKQKGVATDADLLDAKVKLRRNELDLADYGVQLRQLDVQAIQGDRDYQEQLNRITDLTLKQQQIEIGLQRIRQEQLDNRSKRERNISDTQRRIERLTLDLERQSEVRSEHAGRVLEVTVAAGQMLSAGHRLGSLQLENIDGELKSLAYFAIRDGKRIQDGMLAHVTPSTVARERFGSIIGRVHSVSEFPITRDSAAQIVGNPEVAEQLVSTGGAIAVETILKADTSSVSGFEWTSAGPDERFSPGTTTKIHVTVEERAPITWLLPLLRSWIEGGTE